MKKIKIPHISTRNYYDLNTGTALRTGSRYSVLPRRYFQTGTAPHEITIMIHGMRNDPAGAAQKFVIAHRRLRRLGYGSPVIGYTYDSNVRGAHSVKTEAHALRIANTIATKNGKHLAMLISDIRHIWPDTKIRLIGHSLGSIVITSALEKLAQMRVGTNAVESVHLFGASLSLQSATSKTTRHALEHVVHRSFYNYYCPKDAVLQYSVDKKQIDSPLGLDGIKSPHARPKHYVQHRVWPRNHRFVSYAAKLKSFP